MDCVERALLPAGFDFDYVERTLLSVAFDFDSVRAKSKSTPKATDTNVHPARAKSNRHYWLKRIASCRSGCVISPQSFFMLSCSGWSSGSLRNASANQ